MSTESPQTETISTNTDLAIQYCIESIRYHRNRERGAFTITLFIIALFFSSLAFKLLTDYYSTEKHSVGNEATLAIENIKNSQTYIISELNAMVYSYSDSSYYNGIKKQSESIQKNLNNIPTKLSTESVSSSNNIYIYLGYGVFILLFGVFNSYYRFHKREIAKYEHYLLAFHRIRIAATNATTKYDGEVLIALTQDAFKWETTGSLFNSKKNKVESPIPGHPSSDISAVLLSKVIDAIDITLKKGKNQDDETK